MTWEYLVFAYNLLYANQDGVIAVLAAFHALAIAIVNLTPTPRDNEALSFWYSKIEWIAGIWTTRAKQ